MFDDMIPEAKKSLLKAIKEGRAYIKSYCLLKTRQVIQLIEWKDHED